MGRRNNKRTNRKASNIISKQIERNDIRKIGIGMGEKNQNWEKMIIIMYGKKNFMFV
jgi:hypothetical protein